MLNFWHGCRIDEGTVKFFREAFPSVCHNRRASPRSDFSLISWFRPGLSAKTVASQCYSDRHGRTGFTWSIRGTPSGNADGPRSVPKFRFMKRCPLKSKLRSAFLRRRCHSDSCHTWCRVRPVTRCAPEPLGQTSLRPASFQPRTRSTCPHNHCAATTACHTLFDNDIRSTRGKSALEQPSCI